MHRRIAIKGVRDMLSIGPSDLELSMGREGRMDKTDPVVMASIDKILATAKKAGLTAGIYCTSAAYAKQMFAKGFDLVTCTSDTALLRAGAALRREFA